MKSAAVSTVFIIDDDHGVRQAIHDLVESVGLRAESFATGEEFLRTRQIGRLSCLVLDVRLPQVSGPDFQRQLAETAMLIPIQIASEIGASAATVKIHRGNAMHKMQAASVVDLVRVADKLELSPRK